MPYYFYEDPRLKRIRMHRADCGYCERGVATHAQSANIEHAGRWHGPFKTFEDTRRRALLVGLPVGPCPFCLK